MQERPDPPAGARHHPDPHARRPAAPQQAHSDRGDDAARHARCSTTICSPTAIVYLDIGFDLHRLPADLLPYVPSVRPRAARDRRRRRRFRAAVAADRPRRPAASGRSEWTVDGSRQHRPARHGSICAARRCPGRPASCWRSCATFSTGARLDNRERFRQLVLEEKAAFELRLVPAGSSYVDRRLRAQFHRIGLGRRADGRRELSVLPAQARRARSRPTGTASSPRSNASARRSSIAPPCCATSPRRPLIGARVTAAARRFPRRPAAHGAATAAPWQVADTPRAEGLDHPGQGQLCRQGRRPLPCSA